MSAIADANAKITAAFDKLGVAVDGVSADVDFLKAKILELQNNPGPISAEDQAILDQLVTRSESLDAKVEALDAATENPPVVT